MYLIVLGVAFILLKYFAITPVADWSWWLVLSPFAGAFLWWQWADSSGYTQRKAMQEEDQRRQERIERHRQALHQKPRR